VFFQITVTEKSVFSSSLEALMCCIVIMHMEKTMKIFKGAVIGCLKSEFLNLFISDHSNLLFLDLNDCISNFLSGLILAMVYKVA
jgi:hypothetical protein